MSDQADEQTVGFKELLLTTRVIGSFSQTCHQHVNCYYKQLQRLKEENAKLQQKRIEDIKNKISEVLDD